MGQRMSNDELRVLGLLAGPALKYHGRRVPRAAGQLNAEPEPENTIDGGVDLDLREMAQQIYRFRRERDKFFDPVLMGEPVWDMLLAAYFLPTKSRPLSVGGLCGAAECPPTTALRWLECMVEHGLIARNPSELDKRIIFVGLTPAGREKIESYLIGLSADSSRKRV